MGEFFATLLKWVIRFFFIFILWSLSLTVLMKMGILPRIFDFAQKKKDAAAQAAKRKMAQLGDMDAIKEFYGFKGGNVRSKEYVEILKALERAKALSPHEEDRIKPLREIVLYKIRDAEDAEQYLSAVSPDEADFICCYRRFRELIQKDEIREAQNALNVLEKNNCLKIEPKLLSVFYYRMGLSCEKGINGYKKDVKKACEFYKRAVLEYDCSACAEVLVNLGVLLLSGEVDGVIIVREYFLALRCLDLAVHNGSDRAKKITDGCGVGGVIIKPIRAAPVTYHFLYGHQLTAPAETICYLHLMAGLRYQAAACAIVFDREYTKHFSNMQQLVSGIEDFYGAVIMEMLQFGVQVLQFYGVDDYDIDTLANAAPDLSLWPRAPEFSKKLDQINAKAKQDRRKIDSAVAGMKDAGPRWAGGGMGTTIGGTMKAAVKSSVAAAAMNIGTDMLYSAVGGVAKGISGAARETDRSHLFNDEGTKSEFRNAARAACLDIADTVCSILKERGLVSFPGLEEEIFYQGEPLAAMNDKALSDRIGNTSGSKEPEFLQALLLEKLRRAPFSNDTVLRLGRLVAFDPAVTDTLAQYAGDFGLEWSKSE